MKKIVGYAMINFNSFSGRVTTIGDFPISVNDEHGGCYKLITVENEQGDVVNFVVSPCTYFVNQSIVSVRDWVTGYYDANAPVIMIFPPQYRALIMVLESRFQDVKVDYFDSDFLSRDGQLKLNISRNTQVLLPNGQPFTKNPANRDLIVVYSYSTRSIPAQTTPSKIIVWCSEL